MKHSSITIRIVSRPTIVLDNLVVLCQREIIVKEGFNTERRVLLVMQYPLNIEKIRDVLPESYERFWDTVMNLTTFGVDLQMEKTIGPKKNRIGVFGPYTSEGRSALDVIGKIVCKNNYVAITGYGAYVPGKCNECLPSKEYLPPIIDDIVVKFKIPDYVRFHHFPRLVSKAVNLLQSVRTQGNEAEGCFRFGIPMLGIIVDPRVGNDEKGLCNYIVNYTAYEECMCPEKELCLYRDLKPKCPFYDFVDVPWAIKQLFMTKLNRLVALSEMPKLYVVVTEYLTSKMTKPLVWERPTSEV